MTKYKIGMYLVIRRYNVPFLFPKDRQMSWGLNDYLPHIWVQRDFIHYNAGIEVNLTVLTDCDIETTLKVGYIQYSLDN